MNSIELHWDAIYQSLLAEQRSEEFIAGARRAFVESATCMLADVSEAFAYSMRCNLLNLQAFAEENEIRRRMQ